jgi:hypothetical protein
MGQVSSGYSSSWKASESRASKAAMSSCAPASSSRAMAAEDVVPGAGAGSVLGGIVGVVLLLVQGGSIKVCETSPDSPASECWQVPK